MKIFRSITDLIRKNQKKCSGEPIKIDRNEQVLLEEILPARKLKLEKISPFLKEITYETLENGTLNFLSNHLRAKYSIFETDNVSSHQYDQYALEIIDRYKDGMVLDCGCGKRSRYYYNVLNFEIVDYDTTDVIGVGEELPFKDNSFDAVLSLNALEHVKDPFRASSEISRVLKNNGELYCVVPHLQPVHGYPDHYYNMTSRGLGNLFSSDLKITEQKVISSGLPIYTLTWILNSWANGLEGEAKNKFLKLTVEKLLDSPEAYKMQNFVTELNDEKNFELASTTALWARKE